MDIESKTWRIKSCPGGGHMLTNKKTNVSKYVRYEKSASHLARLSESEFDEEMQDVFDNAK